ncbi:MAG: histidine phosphatase family protein [Austwickia sp.]|jgi:broad specificity phosphatase PhoE|nr:MAG: histidine phosphatase family protein [Austwickia sp.]
MTAAPRRLVILRHGVTGHNAAGIWQGHLDTELTPDGLNQARAAAEVLVGYGFARILASDLRRASATARIIGERCGLPVGIDPRLREIHVGAWQGLDAAGVEAAFPGAQARLSLGEDLPRGGDGERVADVVRRARPAADDLIEALAPGETGLIVTHGVCARAIAADLAEVDQRTAWLSLAGLGNCAWAELTQTAVRWRISLWNGRASSLARPMREAHGY